jgi:hypothetical protein
VTLPSLLAVLRSWMVAPASSPKNHAPSTPVRARIIDRYVSVDRPTVQVKVSMASGRTASRTVTATVYGDRAAAPALIVPVMKPEPLMDRPAGRPVAA